jgi:hypothetical protein
MLEKRACAIIVTRQTAIEHHQCLLFARLQQMGSMCIDVAMVPRRALANRGAHYACMHKI